MKITMMNKIKNLVALLLCLIVLAACDDTDELEDRLDNIEGVLGSDSPIKADFSTTDYDDATFTRKVNYSIKPSSYGAQIYDYGNGNYNIQIYRLGDIDGEEYAGLEFDYNAETKEVSNQYAEIEFRNNFGSGREASFYEHNTGNSIEITVKSINLETGSIKVGVIAESTEDYSENVFEGRPMKLTLSFSGRLSIYLGGS
jgi:hypothetical protein